MIEEIIVKFGGSLDGLSTALRGVKGMMHSAGESIKESFKETFKTLFAPLSVAGAFEAVHKLMEDVKNIKRISESTGLDTGITQDLLNLGKASGIASGAIEKMMDKFVSGLAPGSDPEEALMAIADKMAGIEDPALRAKLATDAFGKSGMKLIPILEQGSEGIRKMSEEWGKLSDAEIEELEHADRTIEKTESRAKMQLARTIEWITEIGKTVKNAKVSRMVDYALMPWLAVKDTNKVDDKGVEAEMAIDNAKEAQKVENARKAAEAKKEAGIKAARELAEKEEFIKAKPEEKVLMLTRQILAVRRELEDVDDDKERAKLAEKMVGMEEKRKSIQDKIAQDAKSAAEKEKKNADDILKTKEQISKLGRDRTREQMSEYMPSLQEVANSGRSFFQGNRWQFQQGPFAGMAQQLMSLQTDAKESLIWGNKDRFKKDVSRIDELKKSLTEAGVMSPDDKLTSIDDKIKDSNKHLADLNAAAKTGFVVKGADDE